MYRLRRAFEHLRKFLRYTKFHGRWHPKWWRTSWHNCHRFGDTLWIHGQLFTIVSHSSNTLTIDDPEGKRSTLTDSSGGF